MATTKVRVGKLTPVKAGFAQPKTVVPAFRAAAAPTAPAPAPAAPAPAAPADPRDSSYWAQVTDLHNQRQKKLGDLDRADAYVNTDHDDSTRKLIEAHAKDMMAAKQAQNSRGLFYSTFAGNQNRDLEKASAEQQSGLDEAWRRALAGNQGQRDQINLDLGDGSNENLGSAGIGFLSDAIARALAQVASQDAPLPAPAAGAQPVAVGSHAQKTTKKKAHR